jgi:hypothetical protein
MKKLSKKLLTGDKEIITGDKKISTVERQELVKM